MYYQIRRVATACILYTVLLSASLLGCRKDEETALERTERLLMSTNWKLNRLTVDDIDRTGLYPDMELTALSGTYNCEYGSPVWPSSGTWRLVNETTIERDGMITISIELLNETQLTLSLDWTKTTYEGRLTSVKGHHVFELIKK